MAKSLFIPIEVEALVVNNSMVGETYHRIMLDYAKLYNDDDVDFLTKKNDLKKGIYLKWNLIDALKNGREDSENKTFNFPLIPNRWLVCRYNNSNSKVKSWLIQSDYISNKDGSVSFINPFSKEYEPVTMGKKYNLEDWKEKATQDESFLKAIGSGDILFSVFQPYNENVLSMVDDWDDLKIGDNVSYFVSGWYSNKEDDFIKKEILEQVLEQEKFIKENDLESDEIQGEFIKNEFRLDFDETQLSSIDQSIFYGGVCDIDIKEDRYKHKKPDKRKISIALGNTDTDALGATLDNNTNKYLLELFNEQILNKSDTLNSKFAFEQELQRTWFDPTTTGSLYLSKELHNKKLEEINGLQKEINTLSKELSYKQKELFRILFTKRRYPKVYAFQEDDLIVDYDKNDLQEESDSLGKDIKVLKEKIKEKNDLLKDKLEDKKQVQEISLNNYYMPKDPTITFMGLQSKEYKDELINCSIEELEKNSIFPSLCDGVDFAYKKFLDFNGSKKDEENQDFSKWEQAWTPLFLAWEGFYGEIDFEDGWEFEAKSYKQIKGINPSAKVNLSGKNIITPNNTYTLVKLLENLKNKYVDLSDENLRAIDDLILKVSSWDHLSQKLDGFNLGLIKQTTNVGLPLDMGKNPIDKNSIEHIGDMNDIAPILGGIFDDIDDGNLLFKDFRSGIFRFNSLLIVDSFGQSLELINDQSAKYKTFYLSKDMQGKDNSLVVLPPRLLQACRLNFDIVNEKNENIAVDDTSLENPILAWVLPNHLDKSLDFYNNKGEYLGKVAIYAQGDNNHKVLYKGKEILDGHLKRFLESSIINDLQSYGSFFETIDKTLWNIDPLGDWEDQNLAVLMGRPLALLRAKLEYELQEEPIVYRGWKYALDYKRAKFIDYDLPLLLGSNELRSDSLIGFFEEDNYDQFNCVHLPSTAKDNQFIKQIDSKNLLHLKIGEMDNSNKLIPDKKHITMLVDPRGKVHATSHILPVKKLSVPNKFMDSIKSVQINFRVDSLLSNTISEKEGDEKITMPIPAQNSGDWSFQTVLKGKDKSFDLISSNNDLSNNNTDTSIQSGYLNLKIGDKNE